MDVPHEIQQKLQGLKRSIRRYVAVEGIATVVVVACLLFWLTYGIDLLYYWFSQWELPRGFRLFALIAMGVIVVAILWRQVISGLVRKLPIADLALIIERKFPELNNRLITAVERPLDQSSPLQQTMLNRTVDEAVQKLSLLPVEQTFERRPLRKWLTIAGLLLGSLLILGVANARGMERWYQAYLLQKDNYWDPFRQNGLELKVIAQPGDHIRTFNDQRTYKHPRGADLQLIAETAERTLSPDRVSLQFSNLNPDGIRRGRVTMTETNEGEFRHSLNRIVHDHELWLRGGDFLDRVPFRIEVVDPPRIESTLLACTYPAYTRMESRVVAMTGTRASVPMETEVELRIKVNKSLKKISLDCGGYRLTLPLTAEQAENDESTAGTDTLHPQLTIINEETQQGQFLTLAQTSTDFTDSERTEVRIPFVVTASSERYLSNITAEKAFPLPLTAESTLQIHLLDDDQIENQEPIQLALDGIPDQSPVVETRRTGIGLAVTRLANIPIEGRLTDDYGIAESWFGYRIDQQPEEQRRDLANSPSGQREFELQQSSELKYESFNLIPLELQEGQSFTLAIYARDGDELNGPHVARGELLSFRVVSQDELLARLYDREVALRSRFEQVRSEIAELQASLRTTRQQAVDFESGVETGVPNLPLISAFVERILHQIRKNHTESRSIEVAFRDMRNEMVNNRIDTREHLLRIERQVIAPMELLNSRSFLTADERVGIFRLAVEQQTGIVASIDEVTVSVERLLAEIDAILVEMRDRGTINDLLNDLQRLIDQQKQIYEKTEDKRIEENFFSPIGDSP